MTNLVGQRIAHYQVTALLGEGRLGSVYQAVDLETQQAVALKVVSLRFAQQPDFRQRFLAEVHGLPELTHPSIVAIREAGIDTDLDLLYLAMDYVTGGSLQAFIRQRRWKGASIPLADAVRIGIEVAQALEHAHQRGVLHQDLRPNVILFARERLPTGEAIRRAVVGDFAHKTLLAAEQRTFLPSLPYLAPEQCLRQEVDRRADIYSLGMILYELILGQTAFSPQSLNEAIQQHTRSEPLQPRQLRPDLPPRLEAVLLRTIAKRPAERYQTAAGLAQALQEVAAELPPEATGVGRIEISTVDTVVESPEEQAFYRQQWSTREDQLTITRDVPRSLHRRVITIGREEDNDIALPDASITRRHAQLERTASGWQVRDLGSRNGTFLDGTALLPNIPTEWLGHQTIRIGPYYLQWQKGRGFETPPRPFDVYLHPSELMVVPGRRQIVQVTITNLDGAAAEYALKVERLPADWVTLPATAVKLGPGEQTTVGVQFHPEANGAPMLGKQQFLVLVRSLTAGEEMVAAPGTLAFDNAEGDFAINLEPHLVENKGRCRLTIHNGSILDQTYTINGRNPDDDVQFTEWRPRDRPAAETGGRPAAPPRPPAAARRLPSFWRRLPLVQRIQSRPRQWAIQLVALPRRALNRLLPGLGTALPRGKLAPSAPGVTPAATPAEPTEAVDAILFPGDLQTTLSVPAGGQHRLTIGLAPFRRPWLGRQETMLPFELAVRAATGEEQRVTGELRVTPRIRTRLPATAVVALMLLVCLLSTAVYALLLNRPLAAMLAAPRDMDRDGLGNLAEVYLYGTNPRRTDSDGDGLTDSQEIALGTNPNQADSDGDGLSDSAEQQLNTNALAADTDGDTLADGLEVRTLFTDPLITDTLPVIVQVPTPLPLATATPAPTPRPAPTAPAAAGPPPLTLTSQAGRDGTLILEGAVRGVALADETIIQVGDDPNPDRTSKGILSFDISGLPAGAVIQGAQLRIFVAEQIGQPALLGQLHVDLAPPGGFSDNPALENVDGVAPAAAFNAAILAPAGDNTEWWQGALAADALDGVSPGGLLQFRLYLTLPNNADGAADLVRFTAGDGAASRRPQLIVTYQQP